MISAAPVSPGARPAPPAWVILIALLVAVPTVAFSGLFAFSAVALVDGATADHTAHLSAALAPAGTVTVDASNTAVRVERGADGEVTVDDSLRVRAATRALAQRVVERQDASAIASDSGGVQVTLNSLPAFFGMLLNRDVTIRIPADASLVMRSSNGAGDLSGLSGPVSLTGDNGAYRLTDMTVTASVSVRTINGGISFQGRMAGGSLDLATNNGAITVQVPAGTDAVYDLGTTTGVVTVRRSPGSAGLALGRALSGRLGDGSGGTISAHTHNGSVTLVALV